MSIPDDGSESLEQSQKKLGMALWGCVSLGAGLAVWLLTDDVVSAVTVALGVFLYVVLVILIDFLLPVSLKAKYKNSRTRSILVGLIILATQILPWIFTLHPLAWRRDVGIIGLILILAVMFVPFPKRRVTNPAA